MELTGRAIREWSPTWPGAEELPGWRVMVSVPEAEKLSPQNAIEKKNLVFMECFISLANEPSVGLRRRMSIEISGQARRQVCDRILPAGGVRHRIAVF
jgi:hypothetical protein